MLLLPFVLATVAVAQSNYDQVENSIEFPSPDKGLPESTVLDGKVTKLDELSPVIFLNRTKAALNCAAGYMQVSMMQHCSCSGFLTVRNPLQKIVSHDCVRLLGSSL
jgi:hypothetical protein